MSKGSRFLTILKPGIVWATRLARAWSFIVVRVLFAFAVLTAHLQLTFFAYSSPPQQGFWQGSIQMEKSHDATKRTEVDVF